MTGAWQDWTWRRESGELLDNWGWLTDDELAFITARRPPRAAAIPDDVTLRTSDDHTDPFAGRAAVAARIRHRTR